MIYFCFRIRMMGELNNEMREQAKPVIIHTLRIIGDMADNVLNEVTHTKKLCYGCSKEYIDIALWIFPGYVHDNSMCEELFAFFHTGMHSAFCLDFRFFNGPDLDFTESPIFFDM